MFLAQCVMVWHPLRMPSNTPTVLEGWREGDQVGIHAIAPEDLPALRRWFDGVSPEARYARFLGHISDLSPALWRYLTTVDGQDHVAYVAWLAGSIVGVGRWIRTADEPDLAEIAFLVGDAHQRRGVGGRLRDALIAAARARGIARFRAYVLPDNRAIRRLLTSAQLATTHDGGTTVDVALAA
jgi:RimJ/RimL family protein N-acetyltransferase